MKKALQNCLLIGLLISNTPLMAQSWWSQISNTTENLMNINFYSDYSGIAFGDTLSTMVNSSNQGFAWDMLNPIFIEGDLNSSAYLDANTIVAVGVHDIVGGNGVVLKSTNAGNSWTADTGIPEKLFDVSFANSTSGWISGENGYIARTTDGGTSWLQLTTGTGEDIFSIYFVNANEGWAVGTVAADAVILHTTNAGTNWTEQVSGITEPLSSVFFTDTLNGWAVGASGTILATTDAGVNWNPQVSNTLNDLFDVCFLDANRGWAVGGAGTVLKTTDGGINWIIEASNTGTDIQSITMRNDSLGWFCGDGGIIHVYRNNPPNSINETINSMSELMVFPNPATDRISLKLNSGHGNWKMELYDATGRLVIDRAVLENSSVIIDRGKLESGAYVLVAKDNHGRYHTQKVIFK